jgi:hypothetical protein
MLVRCWCHLTLIQAPKPERQIICYELNGLPIRIALTPGEAHDNRLFSVFLGALLPQTTMLADRG